MGVFRGFPVEALDFYDDLEMDNTKAFWTANKERYTEFVRAPMQAFAEAVAPEFGEAKVFRPHRDVRFRKDKTPYKTHQGLFVPCGPATGRYLQLGAPGVLVGAGFYEASGERLGALREAMVHERHGADLEQILDGLQAAGWTRGGARLKTAPRGYSVDHPRIDLLRHRSLTMGKDYGFDDLISTPQLLDVVRADWREVGDLLDWIVRHGTT